VHYLFIIWGCNLADTAFLIACGSGSSLNQSRSRAQQTFHEIEFRMLLTQPTEGIQFCQFDFDSSFFHFQFKFFSLSMGAEFQSF
jgi:curli biogenesis system outer membrane secretion channel CsgG